MNPTDPKTPRTDAAAAKNLEQFPEGFTTFKPDAHVDASFARQLETELTQARAERDAARRALKLECQDWADDDTRVKAIAAEFGIKDCHENHDAFKGVIEIAEEMAVKIREATNEALAMRAERDEARKLLKLIGSNSENEAGLVISDLTESCRDMKAERDAANALVERLAGALESVQWVRTQTMGIDRDVKPQQPSPKSRNHFPPEPPKTQNHSK